MSHHHDKCGVLVLDAQGGKSWTNQRSARRIVDRGLAVRQPDGTLRMIGSDRRYCSEPQAKAHGPTLAIVAPRKKRRPQHAVACGDCHKVWLPDGTWGTCEKRNGKAA